MEAIIPNKSLFSGGEGDNANLWVSVPQVRRDHFVSGEDGGDKVLEKEMQPLWEQKTQQGVFFLFYLEITVNGWYAERDEKDG